MQGPAAALQAPVSVPYQEELDHITAMDGMALTPGKVPTMSSERGMRYQDFKLATEQFLAGQILCRATTDEVKRNSLKMYFKLLTLPESEARAFVELRAADFFKDAMGAAIDDPILVVSRFWEIMDEEFMTPEPEDLTNFRLFRATPDEAPRATYLRWRRMYNLVRTSLAIQEVPLTLLGIFPSYIQGYVKGKMNVQDPAATPDEVVRFAQEAYNLRKKEKLRDENAGPVSRERSVDQMLEGMSEQARTALLLKFLPGRRQPKLQANVADEDEERRPKSINSDQVLALLAQLADRKQGSQSPSSSQRRPSDRPRPSGDANRGQKCTQCGFVHRTRKGGTCWIANPSDAPSDWTPPDHLKEAFLKSKSLVKRKAQANVARVPQRGQLPDLEQAAIDALAVLYNTFAQYDEPPGPEAYLAVKKAIEIARERARLSQQRASTPPSPASPIVPATSAPDHPPVEDAQQLVE